MTEYSFRLQTGLVICSNG